MSETAGSTLPDATQQRTLQQFATWHHLHRPGPTAGCRRRRPGPRQHRQAGGQPGREPAAVLRAPSRSIPRATDLRHECWLPRAGRAWCWEQPWAVLSGVPQVRLCRVVLAQRAGDRFRQGERDHVRAGVAGRRRRRRPRRRTRSAATRVRGWGVEQQQRRYLVGGGRHRLGQDLPDPGQPLLLTQGGLERAMRCGIASAVRFMRLAQTVKVRAVKVRR